MADLLTAEMAQTIHWSPELADESAWNALNAIADGFHVVIPAEELERLRDDSHHFKNFHRLLCERFGYTHDQKDWRRDQVSLIEWIASRLDPIIAERDRLAGINRELRDALNYVRFFLIGEALPTKAQALKALDAAIAAATK